jgi:hypothetical protein
MGSRNIRTGANFFCKISVRVEGVGRDDVVLSINAKNPGILFACKTSREISLKQLSACLYLGNKQTRFDPASDTICIYEQHINPRRVRLLPGFTVPRGSVPQYIYKFSEVQRVIMEADAGPRGARSILSQLPTLKTLVLASNTLDELSNSLDMDSLRVRCTLDATAMELSTLKEWLWIQRAVDRTLSRLKPMLNRYNEAREVGNHVEITLMKLYNCQV